MKFLSSFAAVIVASIMCVNAENSNTESAANASLLSFDDYSTSTTTSTTSSSKLKSGLELDYLLIDGQSAVGAAINFGGLVFMGEYGKYNEIPVDAIDMFTWSAGAAINKRIYLLNFLYVEGRVGAAYKSYVTSYDGADDISESNWGYVANVRAGLKLFGNMSVNAGYKWNFAEFSFADEYRSTNMTVGVTFLF